jgi:hypothetical protein
VELIPPERTKFAVKDRKGEVVAWHTKVRPVLGRKKFYWSRPDGSPGLNGTPDPTLPLYGSENLDRWTAVILCEGETAVEALWAVKVPALGTVTGAAATPSPEVLGSLAGKDVWLWPDNDDQGRQHMARIEAGLRGVAKSVKWIDWTEAPAKGDAANFTSIHPSRESVLSLLREEGRGPAESIKSHAGPGDNEQNVAYSADRGIVKVEFRRAGVVMEFRRIRHDGRSRDLVCDVEIRSIHHDIGTDLHKAAYYLNSTGARKALAEYLGRRAPGLGVDWLELLEMAGTKVSLAMEQEDPPSLLGEGEASTADTWLLEPLCLAGLPTIIFGQGGSGKSLVALAAGLTIASGAPLLGMAPERTARVAYLDAEMDKRQHAIRMRQLMHDHPLPDVLYVPCGQRPLVEDVDRLAKILMDAKIEYVICDSVAFMAGNDPESSAGAREFYRALKQLNVASLCIAHSTKDGENKFPFGSIFWSNGARQTWYAHGSTSGNVLSVGLYQRKRNVTRAYDPIGLKFTFDADRIWVANSVVGSDPPEDKKR